jgi:3-oxoacyl-[acyl-carrier protein] reductase
MSTPSIRPLQGRTAIITGGTRNIGRAVALALAADGASVVLASRQRDDDAIETIRLVERIGSQAEHVSANVTSEADVERLTATALQRFGGIHALVHCAAIRRVNSLADISLNEWREVMATNLDAAFLCSKSVLPHLKSGTGRLVYISGLTAFKGADQRAHVIASKAGLVGLARALATELAPRQITVNCVSPGPTNTVRGADAGNVPPVAYPKSMEPLLGRHGQPEEIAAAVRYLVSDGAAFTTGQVIHVNGGLYFG